MNQEEIIEKLVKAKRIVALDLEGDGLSAQINQKIFPNGNHFDPNTRIWCASIATKLIGDCKLFHNETITHTMCAKLNGTRPVIDDNGRMAGMTVAEHYLNTVVPQTMQVFGDDRHIVDVSNEARLIKGIKHLLSILDAPDVTTGTESDTIICVKGYGEYNYDAMLLNAACKRLGLSIPANKFSNLINVSPIIGNWNPTHSQIKVNQYVDNQKYLETGIRHCIEDTIQLCDYLYKAQAYYKKLNNIHGDF